MQPSLGSAKPEVGGIGRARGAADHRYLWLSIVVLLLVAAQTLNGHWSTDMWEHVAVVRELIAHPFDPAHPQVLSDATHPGFSPYTVLVGVLGNRLDVDAVTMLSWAAMANVALLLAALRVLVIEVTENRRAPFWALVFILALWGFEPYRYSGFFGLNSIGFVASYPSTFATAIAFGTLVAAIRYARSGSRHLLLVVALGAALVVLSHPLSAPWLVLALMAVAIRWSLEPRSLLCLGTAAAVGLGLCLLWPYFPILGLIGDSSDLETLNRSMYDSVLKRVFPLLLGLPVVVRRLREDHRDLLGLWLLGSAGLYVVGAVTDNSSFGRALAFIVVVLVIAMADGVARIEASGSVRAAGARTRVGAMVLGGLLVLGLVTARGGLVRMIPDPLLPASIRGSDELIRPDEEYAFLRGFVGPREVVVGSKPAINRVIPAVAGRTLTLAVPRPFVDDAAQRKQAQKELLDVTTSGARRSEINVRYHVRFMLLRAGAPGDRALRDVLVADGAAEVYRDARHVLVELPPAP